MDRRDFLKTSSIFFAAGILIPNAAKSMLSKSLNNGIENFSIEVITENSDSASLLLEDFVKSGIFGKGSFNYSEYPVSGSVMGDLIYISNNELINFTKSNDDISLKLKEIRKKLNLPSILSNPVRLRLYRNSGKEISRIIISQRGKIISRIQPDNSGLYTFNGKSGKLILNVNNRTASVFDVECKHKICKQMNSINKPGDYITCIPNELHIFAE